MILTYHKLTKWTQIILILFYASALSASIGNVDQLEGNGVVERNKEDTTLEKELSIEQFDTVKTGNGKVGILFIDDTRVDVTQHSKLIIDEFVYDPNTKKGKLSLSAKLGTVRYASGQIAKTSRQDVQITTPTATIGVRGTDFSMTIDELGGSTIILLPSCDVSGNCFVGEISVESAAGQVILNQAFQATQVNTPANPPSPPVRLDLELDMINNMLIVAKPAELKEENYEAKLKAVDGIYLGKNPETGVIILDEDPQWLWAREDAGGQYIELRLDKQYGYYINIIQGEFEMYDFELGGQDNEITIIQIQ